MVWWAESELPRSPMFGACGGAIDSNKVVLTGNGLREARAKTEAEFIIDGSEAGAGKQAPVPFCTN